MNWKIIAVHFPIDTKYNTSAKRRAFIKKLGVEPLKRQHKTASKIMYRINEANKNKKHITIKKDGFNIILEK